MNNNDLKLHIGCGSMFLSVILFVFGFFIGCCKSGEDHHNRHIDRQIKEGAYFRSIDGVKQHHFESFSYNTSHWMMGIGVFGVVFVICVAYLEQPIKKIIKTKKSNSARPPKEINSIKGMTSNYSLKNSIYLTSPDNNLTVFKKHHKNILYEDSYISIEKTKICILQEGNSIGIIDFRIRSVNINSIFDHYEKSNYYYIKAGNEIICFPLPIDQCKRCEITTHISNIIACK